MPQLVRHHLCAELLAALESQQKDMWLVPVRGQGFDGADGSQRRAEVAAAGWHLALTASDGLGKLVHFPGVAELATATEAQPLHRIHAHAECSQLGAH